MTGSASGHQTDTVFRKYPFEVFRLEVFDGFQKKLGGVVRREGILAGRIDIDPKADVDARFLESVRKPAGTAE